MKLGLSPAERQELDHFLETLKVIWSKKKVPLAFRLLMVVMLVTRWEELWDAHQQRQSTVKPTLSVLKGGKS